MKPIALSPTSFSSPVILSAGFRSFFPLTALHASLSILLWMVWLAAQQWGDGLSAQTLATPAFLWHAHEMVFGFLSAAVAGFLLTAVPNWTRTPPAKGRKLAFLVGLWVLGRLAFWLSALWPAWVMVTLDVLFLPALAWVIGSALQQAKNTRNMPFVPLLLALAIANLIDNLSLLDVLDVGSLGRDLAINVVVVMMVIISGRIAPSFTRNWLIARGRPAPDLTPAALEKATILSALTVLLVDVVTSVAPTLSMTTGTTLLRAILCAVAGVLVLTRLVLWTPWRVRSDSLLWVLHLGVFWVGLGFLLRAIALTADSFPASWLSVFPDTSNAIHAHLIGAAGTLILGVMGRASLAHSGHPLKANALMTASYVLISLAALTRVFGPSLWPDQYIPAVTAAALLWCLAFVFFLKTFIPILGRPSLDA